jgi:8-oxo-dGTP diphosphatase
MTGRDRLNVVCAIIKKNERILAVRRKKGENMAGQWEFPGGKIRAGESPGETLIREILEELEIKILPDEPLPPVEYDYPEFSIRLMPFRCKWLKGTIEMHVHDQCKWLTVSELDSLNWSKADLVVVEMIKGKIGNKL